MTDHKFEDGRKVNRRRFLTGVGAASAIAGVGLNRKVSWAQEETGKGTLRLLFYTDVHARVEWETPAAMAKAADAINKTRPDMVINGGDLITDGFQAANLAEVQPRWDAYMKMHKAIKGDVFSTIGNHDLVAAAPRDGSPPAADPRKPFKDHLGLSKTYYSFEAMGYHFIFLDSIHIIGGKLNYQGLIWPEQMAWLREDLAQTPKDRPIILTTHMPLLTAFFGATRGALRGGTANRVMVNNRGVLDLFKEHNLMLVLQGHLHAKELLRWRDTTFITGGAICAKWWRGNWYGTEEGFNIITLHDGRVDWEYVDYGWEAKRPANL